MKISKQSQEQGSALALTLITGLVIGLILASYLGLMSSRYKITIRSQVWNGAMPVAEQGVEEAMAHLVDDTVTSPTANNWTLGTLSGQTVYSKQRTNADGSYFLADILYTVTNTQIIYSSGFVPTPLQSGSYISRTVRVTTTNSPVFAYAFAAMGSILMNGNGLASDSFNSAKTNLSTNGQYDPTKTSTNGNVASVYGPVNLGNHNIDGSLYLGPTATGSTVGQGQVLGSIYTDYNVSFADVTLPSGLVGAAPLSAPIATVNGTSSYYFTIPGNYYITSSTMPVIIAPGVNVQVRVDATSFNPSTLEVQTSTNSGAGSISVYQVAGSANLGPVTVDSGRAENFYYYGLPGVTNVTAGGTGNWIGVIYAPEAALTLNGGGNNNGLVGACVVKSIWMNGHYDFHYDEDLLTHGPKRPAVPNGWQEI